MSGYGEETELPEVTYDYLLKIICIGESGTGKTCLLHHFLNSSYRGNSPHTIGVNFSSTVLKLPSTVPPASPRKARSNSRGSLVEPPIRRIKLQIWDTAGQERFRSVTRNYYRGAGGLILCYDITRRSTFENLNAWLEDARALAAPHLLGVVVGNFLDLEHDQREVSFEEGELFAKQNGLTFVEASSLTGENVNQPFHICARAVLEAVESGRIDPGEQGSGIAFGERALKRASSWSTLRGPSKTSRILTFCDCS